MDTDDKNISSVQIIQHNKYDNEMWFIQYYSQLSSPLPYIQKKT